MFCVNICTLMLLWKFSSLMVSFSFMLTMMRTGWCWNIFFMLSSIVWKLSWDMWTCVLLITKLFAFSPLNSFNSILLFFFLLFSSVFLLATKIVFCKIFRLNCYLHQFASCNKKMCVCWFCEWKILCAFTKAGMILM